MSKQIGALRQTNDPEHLIRPRLNALLGKAVEKRLVIVCAGTGYGKTWAVDDYVRESNPAVTWIKFSELDNAPSRFWENFINAVSKHINSLAADELFELGFPDTEDKWRQCYDIIKRCIADLPDQKYLRVLDDFHLIKNPDIITFLERFLKMSGPNCNHSSVLICREYPQINIAEMSIQDKVAVISEDDLVFTEIELSQYLARQSLSVEPSVLYEILRDTGGWAFSLNLVAHSLKRTPGYDGYSREAMKNNISKIIESEVWNAISEALRHFLTRLSLIEHLSADLIEALAGKDQDLLTEFRRQNAYIRYDSRTNSYMIHQLLLDYLCTKQGALADDERRETYKTAAVWCRGNGFIVDAMDYYEKADEYGSIVSVFFDLPFFLSHDFALRMLEIFERIHEVTFDQVDFLAVMKLRIFISLWRPQEFDRLASYYEQRYLGLPENDMLRRHTLGLICYFRGIMRYLMSTSDGQYDFAGYFAEMDKYLKNTPITPGKWLANNLGPWANGFGSGGEDEAKKYVEAVISMGFHVNRCLNGIMNGLDGLAAGELKFYQGDIQAAGPMFISAIENARKVRQFDTVHRAMFYIMRSAFLQGKRHEAEQALNGIKALLEEKEYPQRFVNYDIARGWYYYILRQPDMVPGWLKEKFSPYGHAFFPENFGNQLKVRYHYMTKNFAPLLAYIDEMKQRESVLYGRIEMLTIEACVRYQMRDRAGALTILRVVYDTASENDFVMPFIELGKDMRTLTISAIRNPDCAIPLQWLEYINKKVSLYARYQAKVIVDYEEEIGVNSWIPLSSRETEVLHDLYAGFSRKEIAAKQGLSLGTIHMNVQNIFSKLHAQNVVDAIRIAVERKLV